MISASRRGWKPGAVSGGAWLGAAIVAAGLFGSDGGPRRPAEVPASVPVPPPRPFCSLLADTGTHEEPRLSGLAEAGGALDRFVSAYGGTSRIGHGITAVNPAFCPVLDAIAPFAEYQPNGPLRLRIEARVPVHTTIKPATQAPSGSAVALDLFSAKGEVVHVLPASSTHPQATWTAQPPIGPWLAVALAAERPLLAGRPASEPAAPYLEALTQALRETRDTRVDAVQIDVVSAPPVEEAARRPGCEKVAAINERAQTEGQLSDEDKAILRSCRR